MCIEIYSSFQDREYPVRLLGRHTSPCSPTPPQMMLFAHTVNIQIQARKEATQKCFLWTRGTRILLSPSWVHFGKHKHKQRGSPFSRKHCQKLNRTLNTPQVNATEGQRCDPRSHWPGLSALGSGCVLRSLEGSDIAVPLAQGLSRRRRRGRARLRTKAAAQRGHLVYHVTTVTASVKLRLPS